MNNQPTTTAGAALTYGDAQRVRYYNERLDGMERPALMLTLAERMGACGEKVLFWDDAIAALATPDADAVLNDAVAKGACHRSVPPRVVRHTVVPRLHGRGSGASSAEGCGWRKPPWRCA